MTRLTAENAARQDFMPLMRALVRAYQAFAALDAEGLRVSGSGLTTSQADVIFTLGNTEGMSCKQIGARTLITKGTLTGVIDRLADKGLVTRLADANDGRRTIVRLTARGERLFEQEFPRQIAYLKLRFERMEAAQRRQATALFDDLRKALQR